MLSVQTDVDDVYSPASKFAQFSQEQIPGRPAEAPAPVDENVHYRTVHYRTSTTAREPAEPQVSKGTYAAAFSVLSKAKVSKGARFLWLVIFEHLNDRTGVACPSMKTLTAWLQNECERATQRWLRELRATGLVEVIDHRGPSGTQRFRLRDADGCQVLGRAQGRRVRDQAGGGRHGHRGVVATATGGWSPRPPNEVSYEVSYENTPLPPVTTGTGTGTSPTLEPRNAAQAPRGEPRCGVSEQRKPKPKPKAADLDEVQAWDRGDRGPLRELVTATAQPTTLEPVDVDVEIADSLAWRRKRGQASTLDTLVRSVRTADDRRKATRAAAGRAAATLTTTEAKGTRSIPGTVPRDEVAAAAERRRWQQTEAELKAAGVKFAAADDDEKWQPADDAGSFLAQMAARAAQEGQAGPAPPPHPSPILGVFGVAGGAA